MTRLSGRLDKALMFDAQVKSEWRAGFLHPFLQISPTYRMAHHIKKAGKMQGLDYPNDIEIVEKVYSDFGDVWKNPAEDWWLNNAKYNFDPLESLKPTLIEEIPAQSITSQDQMDLQHLHSINGSMNRIAEFWNYDYAEQFFPDCAIIGVPLHGDQEKIKRLLCNMVDRSFKKSRQSWKKSKYGFKTRSRIQKLTLDKCLFAVKFRACNPDKGLTDIGGAITKRYTPQHLEVDGFKQSQRHSEIQTSELLYKALKLAEWAARLNFPCTNKLNQTVALSGLPDLYKPRFDYEFIASQISAGNISEP